MAPEKAVLCHFLAKQNPSAKRSNTKAAARDFDHHTCHIQLVCVACVTHKPDRSSPINREVEPPERAGN
jgi:hypothetical protein